MAETPEKRERRDDSATAGADGDELAEAYRHDIHKLRGRRHDAAQGEFRGVSVNQTVSHGADRDAAMLSRPPGDPEATVPNHVSSYRRSLLTGETVLEGSSVDVATNAAVRALITPSDPERLHAAWLTNDLAAAFNEAVHYPYTSLKYHVLLTAALLDNYRAGVTFDELFVVIERGTAPGVNPDASEAMASPSVMPHRTVLWTPAVAMHVTGAPPDGVPATRLGCEPSRSFADVWSQSPQHPIDVDGTRVWMVLDAQLRRVRSWSVALQFIEEYCARFGTAHTERRGSDPAGMSTEVRES